MNKNLWSGCLGAFANWSGELSDFAIVIKFHDDAQRYRYVCLYPRRFCSNEITHFFSWPWIDGPKICGFWNLKISFMAGFPGNTWAIHGATQFSWSKLVPLLWLLKPNQRRFYKFLNRGDGIINILFMQFWLRMFVRMKQFHRKQHCHGLLCAPTFVMTPILLYTRQYKQGVQYTRNILTLLAEQSGINICEIDSTSNMCFLLAGDD